MDRLTFSVFVCFMAAVDVSAGDPPIKELGREGYAEGVIYNVDVKGEYFDLRTADGQVRARRQYSPILFKKEWGGATPMTMEDVAKLIGFNVAVTVQPGYPMLIQALTSNEQIK